MAFKIKISKVDLTTIVETYDSKKPDIKDIYLYNNETDVVLNKRLEIITIPAPCQSMGYKELHLTLDNADFDHSASTIEELLDYIHTNNFFTNTSSSGDPGGSVNVEKEEFEFEGVFLFNLLHEPTSILTVSINHTFLSENAHYTYSGNELDLTLSSGTLFPGDKIFVTYLK